MMEIFSKLTKYDRMLEKAERKEKTYMYVVWQRSVLDESRTFCGVYDTCDLARQNIRRIKKENQPRKNFRYVIEQADVLW